MARTVAWGIDIGESAIKAVKLRKTGDSVVIQDYRTVPCESRPDDAQGSDKDFRIRNALATLQREVKLAGATIAVSMPGRDVFPRFITLPPVDKKRIPELVRYEARTQMPFPIDEVIWDYQPLVDEVVPGEEVEVALFAIKRASVYGFLTNLRLSGLTPDVVEITPLALYNLIMYDRPVDTGTVLIDIGAGNTDLVILDGEKFWTRNVSISGNDITRSLQEKYQISFEEAENLKRKAATSAQAEKIFGVMRPILDDLIGEIQRSIGYYKAQSRNVRIEHVILLGNVFKLKGMLDYFRKNLDYEVSLLDSLRRVKLGAESDQRKFEAELPNYGVSIGLALQALGLGRVDIDLMPRELVTQRLLRRKIPWAAAALALLAIPIGFGFMRARKMTAAVDEKLPPIQTEIRRLEGNKRTLDELKNNSVCEEQLKGFVEVGRKRDLWVKVFDRLNKAFSQLDRDRFLVLAVREPKEDRRARAARPAITQEMMAEGAVPMMPGTGEEPVAEVKKAAALVVELQFEKQGQPEGWEVNYLQTRLNQPGVLSVKFQGVDKLQDRTRTIEEGEIPSFVYTVHVTFGEKPAAQDKAAGETTGAE